MPALKNTTQQKNGLSRYVVDLAIVLVACALLLFGARGEHALLSDNVVTTPAISGTPPPLTYLQNMTAIHADTPYSLDLVAQDRGKPIVVANRPPSVTLEKHLATTLTGWAVDGPTQRAADALYVLIDGKLATSCHIGMPRADVEAAYKIPAYAMSGFSCTIPAARIVTGRHALELDIVAQGGHTFYAVTPPTAFIVR